LAYRCVAENSAGRSEVTFKAWINPAESFHRTSDVTDVVNDESHSSDGRTNSEIVVGVSLGVAAVTIAAVVACVTFAVRRRRPCHRKYAYYVRDGHGNGTAKLPPASPSCVRQLAVRGRQFFRASSIDADADAGCGDSDDVDEKLVCSTLQSLLEAKQLVDESPPRDDEDVDKGERQPEREDLLQADNCVRANEETAGELCKCADSEITADDSDLEHTGHEGLKDPAPDLLTGDGHTFRRGGVARSPYRRSKPKVSFADCRSPSSDFTSGDSTSSQMSSTPGRQVGDGTDSVSGSTSDPRCGRQICSVADVLFSSSKDKTSTTGAEPVHRSMSSNAVCMSKVPAPPPPTQLVRIIPTQRRRQPRHTNVDVDSVDIALPATISGITEGLFPPTELVRTCDRKGGGECRPRLGPRFSEPTIRHTPRNAPPRAASRGTEV